MPIQITELLKKIQEMPNLPDEAREELLTATAQMKDGKGTVMAFTLNLLKFLNILFIGTTIAFIICWVDAKDNAEARCNEEKAEIRKTESSYCDQKIKDQADRADRYEKKSDSLQALNTQLLKDEDLRRFELLKMKINSNSDEQTIIITPKKQKP